MGLLDDVHYQRCAKKEPYINAAVADKRAEQVSRLLGELVLSYKCFDCEFWHIGHADLSQEKTHRPIEQVFCVYCREFIPEHRHKELLISGDNIWTCSSLCAKRRKSGNQKKRRKARVCMERST